MREFLSDPRVIDLHPLRWYPILYLFVLTLRPKRSAALYANIWTDEGSPLMVHSKAQTRGLQERLGDDYRVILGMRYGEPSIARAIGTLEQEGIDRILVFPMYPQFSCTTTGSIYDAVNRAAGGRRCPWFFDRKRSMPALRFVPPYYDHPAYIDALRQSVADEVARLDWTPDRYPPHRKKYGHQDKRSTQVALEDDYHRDEQPGTNEGDEARRITIEPIGFTQIFGRVA